jgi:hypothetical protein
MILALSTRRYIAGPTLQPDVEAGVGELVERMRGFVPAAEDASHASITFRGQELS